ncbi:MAG: FAD-dependent oxidoreductase [Planctomycetota bacterium]
MRALLASLLASLLVVLSACAGAPPADAPPPREHDVVVYGATSAGVTAAVRAARAGLDVVLIEPGAHVGGLSAAGLGATDIGNKRAIGGLSRGFYRRVRAWYADDAHWVRGERGPAAGWRDGEDAMWRFEPHVAERIFEDLLAEAGVSVVCGERLDRGDGVALDGQRLTQVRMESGAAFAGRMFIDATYEGDLMAAAGVPYTVGRESNATYGESLNGVQTANAVFHQFVAQVDPYVVPGDPTSGLLPGVHGAGSGSEGAADRRVQAYCFRMCLTDDPANRIPFARPEDYDEARYELLLRHFEAGAERLPWHSIGMPNRKTDTNNNRAFSTDHIGANYAYPEAGYAERERIVSDHESYQRGLVWTLANHPRVPAKIRAEASRWGLAADEFRATGGWPHALYIREARRMVADYVVTDRDCLGARRAPDPVGLGAYNMDSHNVQRYVDADGYARNEGDVQVAPEQPYGISYRSIVPPRGSAENLFVPVCASASHIAYGSLRMEPVFMTLGHSAATAAVLALERGLAVQDVPYDELSRRLRAEGQVLTWEPASD